MTSTIIKSFKKGKGGKGSNKRRGRQAGRTEEKEGKEGTKEKRKRGKKEKEGRNDITSTIINSFASFLLLPGCALHLMQQQKNRKRKEGRK